MQILNVKGLLFRTLAATAYPSGKSHVVWDGTDNYSNRAAEVPHICRIKAGDFKKSVKMNLVR